MSRQVQDAYIVAAARTPIGKAPRGAFRNTRPDDLLVAAAPREVVQEIRAALASRGIGLHHLTVLPAAVVRLHEAFLGTADAAAVAVALPNYSVAGFFHATR